MSVVLFYILHFSKRKVALVFKKSKLMSLGTLLVEGPQHRKSPKPLPERRVQTTLGDFGLAFVGKLCC